MEDRAVDKHDSVVSAGGTEPDVANRPPPLPDAIAPELRERWEAVQEVLARTLRREQLETWFRRTALVAIEGDRAVVAVHNGFTRDWLVRYYGDVLHEAVSTVLDAPTRVEFLVDPERAPRARRESPSREEPEESIEAVGGGPLQAASDGLSRSPAAPQAPRIDASARPAGAPPEPGAGAGLLSSSDVTLNPHYRFDNFVVGPCNRFAQAACFGVAENPGRTYNPLFLHGSVGLGKTHLLQSLCHALLEREPGARILYLSCETFVNHFISALENGDLATFRTKYRNVDLLVVDDIHVLANKERTQEEFFHTFNTLYNAGKQIVLSSDSPPVEIPTLQERLVSRFKWGLVTELEPPCYETRMAILKRKSRERGRELPDEVASFLAERIDTNIRELEGAVNKVLGFASLSGQDISLHLVRQCLRELFSVRTNQPSIEDIMGVVTVRFGVKLAELQSKKRTNAIAYPRQIGMYLARRITRMSLEEIGGYFGGRDHSTVLHGVRKISRMAKEDPGCRALLAELSLELQGQPPA